MFQHVVQKMKADVPKDISLAEAGKYGSLTDFAFFDKVCLSVVTCLSCLQLALCCEFTH